VQTNLILLGQGLGLGHKLRSTGYRLHVKYYNGYKILKNTVLILSYGISCDMSTFKIASNGWSDNILYLVCLENQIESSL
jgi:hypothetical protein